MSELKPCPFCGGTKITIANCVELEACNNFEECTDRENVAVVCDLNQGGCGASSGYRATFAEAIAAWNRRVGGESE